MSVTLIQGKSLIKSIQYNTKLNNASMQVQSLLFSLKSRIKSPHIPVLRHLAPEEHPSHHGD